MFKKLKKKRVLIVVNKLLLPIFLGGLAGGLITITIFIWPTVYGANWWDVFTAIGTVASAFFAVWIASYNKTYYEKEKKDNAKRYLASAFVDIKKSHGFLCIFLNENQSFKCLNCRKSEITQKTSEILDALKNIDLLTLTIASRVVADKLIQSQDGLVTAIIEINKKDPNYCNFKTSLVYSKEKLKQAINTIEIIDYLLKKSHTT